MRKIHFLFLFFSFLRGGGLGVKMRSIGTMDFPAQFRNLSREELR